MEKVGFLVLSKLFPYVIFNMAWSSLTAQMNWLDFFPVKAKLIQRYVIKSLKHIFNIKGKPRKV